MLFELEVKLWVAFAKKKNHFIRLSVHFEMVINGFENIIWELRLSFERVNDILAKTTIIINASVGFVNYNGFSSLIRYFWNLFQSQVIIGKLLHPLSIKSKSISHFLFDDHVSQMYSNWRLTEDLGNDHKIKCIGTCFKLFHWAESSWTSKNHAMDKNKVLIKTQIQWSFN